jgi:hypothetical protein
MYHRLTLIPLFLVVFSAGFSQTQPSNIKSKIIQGLVYPDNVKLWKNSDPSKKLFDKQPYDCKEKEAVYWEDIASPEGAKIEGILYGRIKKITGNITFTNPYDEVRTQALNTFFKGKLYFGFRVASASTMIFSLCVV